MIGLLALGAHAPPLRLELPGQGRLHCSGQCFVVDEVKAFVGFGEEKLIREQLAAGQAQLLGNICTYSTCTKLKTKLFVELGLTTLPTSSMPQCKGCSFKLRSLQTDERLTRRDLVWPRSFPFKQRLRSSSWGKSDRA